jgi:hypothetical protein
VRCELDGILYERHDVCRVCDVLLGSEHAVPRALKIHGLCDRCEVEGPATPAVGSVEACGCYLIGGVCQREERLERRAERLAMLAAVQVKVLLLPRAHRAKALGELMGLSRRHARRLVA